MAASLPTPNDVPLLEQAAGWFDRRSSRSLGADEIVEFERWRESPANQLAYAEVEAAYAQAKASAHAPEMLGLRHEALSRIVLPHVHRKRRLLFGGAIAASLIAAVGIGSWSALPDLARNPAPIASIAPHIYQTAVGEKLTVSLPDGSSVTLNTASRLLFAYNAKERRLVLEQGQALFRVAKGQARPFIVQALDRIVTAHGTAFDVLISPGRKLKVSLLEGSVSVASNAKDAPRPTELRPKDVLIASNGEVQVSRDPDIEKEVSWRDGLIIFEDDSLAQATSEVNRYVRTPIVLQDDRLKRIRVSGAFRTGETDAFVEALQLSFPVRVVERDKDKIVLAYRG